MDDSATRGVPRSAQEGRKRMTTEEFAKLGAVLINGGKGKRAELLAHAVKYPDDAPLPDEAAMFACAQEGLAEAGSALCKLGAAYDAVSGQDGEDAVSRDAARIACSLAGRISYIECWFATRADRAKRKAASN